MSSLPEVDELRKSFSKIYDGPDHLQREYEIIREAERLNIPVDTYRRLYELRAEEKSEPYPKSKSLYKVIPEWSGWFLRIPQKEKFFLFRKGIFWLAQKGVLVTGVVALGHYIWEAPTRQKQAHYQAWQMINSASGQGGSGGRIEAMQDLARDGVSLQGLSAPKANLRSIKLNNAYLNNANLQGADLGNANLKFADLGGANLREANLKFADLGGANLREANLRGADLGGANLRDANLREANLRDADLRGADLAAANLRDADLGGANLQSAYLWDADLRAANLRDASLRDANLQGVNLQGADLGGADLGGAKNLTPTQIKAAKNWDKVRYSPEFRNQLGLPPENSESSISGSKQVSPSKISPKPASTKSSQPNSYPKRQQKPKVSSEARFHSSFTSRSGLSETGNDPTTTLVRLCCTDEQD